MRTLARSFITRRRRVIRAAAGFDTALCAVLNTSLGLAVERRVPDVD